MVYHGYTIDSKWLNTTGINWKMTGNGTYVTGTKGGKRYFIKRSVAVRFPSSKLPKASYDIALNEFKKCRDKQMAIAKRFADMDVTKDHIVPEVDHFVDEDNYFVTVTPFIEGIVDFDKLSFPSSSAVIKLAIGMCECVKRIHSVGVIHADIKPQNYGFLKTSTGYTPLLLDFDNSFVDGSVPDYDTLGGTEGYQPPEAIGYIDGEDGYDEKSITKAIDIFSLALTMFHIFTKALPRVEGARDVGGALLYEKSFSLEGKLNFAIGPKFKTPFASLIKEMLLLDYTSRPTIDSVLDILSDRKGLDGESLTGETTFDDTPRFELSLWEEDEGKGSLLSEAELKEKGVTSFYKEDVGGMHLYSVTIKDVTNSLSLKQLIEKGFFKEKKVAPSIVLDEPHPEDEIVFLPPEELASKGVDYIRATKNFFKKGYRISVNGLAYDTNKKDLLLKGFAKEKGKVEYADLTPFPEDGSSYDESTLTRRGIASIAKEKRGEERVYILTYKDGHTQEVKAKIALITGLIKK